MRTFRVFTRNLSHICKLQPYKETKWLMPYGNPTGIYVYNCIAKEKVPVILNDPHLATWYSCGPTVYDSAHIGHASCYVKLDIIQRILKSFFNIKLVTAMGITDIDDKIIKKAQDTNSDFTTVAKQYENEFWRDMSSLNVQKPLIITRVSEHMDAIDGFVKALLDSGVAYRTEGGSVYFDTEKYPSYGKFIKMQKSEEKKSKHKNKEMDFALWKGHKPGEPFWNVSWGKGRPGWHIECSAMVSKVFGSQLDFHAGGIDLKFPHHENEEAQSCSYHKTRQWANYWLHVGHLNVAGDTKMSKSLKNTVSIPDILSKYSADTFRMACLMSNYRYAMEYTDDMMKSAETVLNKFIFFLKDANIYINDSSRSYSQDSDKLVENLHKVEESVITNLQSDFDTSTCINSLISYIADCNRIIKKTDSNFYPLPIALVVEFLEKTLKNFGLQLDTSNENIVSEPIINSLVEFRHTVRLNAMANKNNELFKACDLVREQMKSNKIQINDTSKTPSWVYVK